MKKVLYVVVGYFTMKRHYVFEDKAEAERMAEILNDELYDVDFFEVEAVKG